VAESLFGTKRSKFKSFKKVHIFCILFINLNWYLLSKGKCFFCRFGNNFYGESLGSNDFFGGNIFLSSIRIRYD